MEKKGKKIVATFFLILGLYISTYTYHPNMLRMEGLKGPVKAYETECYCLIDDCGCPEGEYYLGGRMKGFLGCRLLCEGIYISNRCELLIDGKRFHYDDNGLLSYVTDKNDSIIERYEYKEFDYHGNWTKRWSSYEGEVIRHIEYYDTYQLVLYYIILVLYVCLIVFLFIRLRKNGSLPSYMWMAYIYGLLIWIGCWICMEIVQNDILVMFEENFW